MALSFFHWIIPNAVAGSARPGLLDTFEEDAREIRDRGFRWVVTLEEEELPHDFEPWGLKSLHFPIQDMGIPTSQAAALLCGKVLRSIQQNEPVLFHCRAGMGRTGTLLAACLIFDGQPAEDAVHRIRCIDRHYIQSEAQERFLEHFDQFVNGRGDAAEPTELPKLTLPAMGAQLA